MMFINNMFKNMNKKISVKTGIIIILVVVLFCGGILAYQYWNMLKQKAEVPELVIVDEILSWENYNNEKYAYQIKYPSGANVQKEGEPPFPGPPLGVQFSVQLNESSYCNVGVEANGFNQYEIDDLRGKGYTESTVSVDGVSAVRLTSNESGGGEFIYLKDANNDFRITRGGSFGAENEAKCIKIFNQMISTFIFSFWK